MKGKAVILSVLLLNLFLAQVQVEAKKKSCCPSTLKRNAYNACRWKFSQETCAKATGCILQDSQICKPPNNHEVLQNSGDIMNEYCKLGCASSVCNAITTLQNSDAGEVENEAIEECINACSVFCTKGPIGALEIE